MGTAEWIALGLLLIALIGWLRWRGTPDDQKKDGPSQVLEGKTTAKQEISVTSSRLSSFAADRRAHK